MSDQTYLQTLLDAVKATGLRLTPEHFPQSVYQINAPLTCINSPYPLMMEGKSWCGTHIRATQPMSCLLDLSGTRFVLKEFTLSGAEHLHTNGLVTGPGPASFDRCFIDRVYISGSFSNAAWQNTAVGSSSARELMAYNYNKSYGQVILFIDATDWLFTSCEAHLFTNNNYMPALVFRHCGGIAWSAGNFGSGWGTGGGRSAFVAWDHRCFGRFSFHDNAKFYIEQNPQGTSVLPTYDFIADGPVNVYVDYSCDFARGTFTSNGPINFLGGNHS